MNHLHNLIIIQAIMLVSALFAVLAALSHYTIFILLGSLQLYDVGQHLYIDNRLNYTTASQLGDLLVTLSLTYFGIILFRSHNNTLVRKTKPLALCYVYFGLLPLISYSIESWIISGPPTETTYQQLLRFDNQSMVFTVLVALLAFVYPFILRPINKAQIRQKQVMIAFIPLILLVLSTVNYVFLLQNDALIAVIPSILFSIVFIVFFYLLRAIIDPDGTSPVALEAEIRYPTTIHSN